MKNLRLRSARAAKGLSQQALADLVGVGYFLLRRSALLSGSQVE